MSADGPGGQKVPKGSVAVGRRVRIPAGAEPPISVYINGVAQSEGEDYEISAGEIVFNREILKEEVGLSRWMAIGLGLFGTYRTDETIDVEFSRDGNRQLAADLPVHRD